MLCDTCRYNERPGFVRVRRDEASVDEVIPCPECGGQGIAHCCDGICEQPDIDRPHNTVNDCGAMSDVTSTSVRRGDIQLEVPAQGSGHRVVLLPSLGRGAADFDVIAMRIAAAGFRVLRPQPRGIGLSRSPEPYADLHDCAADIATVIEADGGGAALVAGHAFGNRVARMLATDRPELVRGVSLIAANVGHAPSTPPIREAIRNSANPALPDEERLKALQFAFFAPGNDPRPWLKGWHPQVLAAQRIAGDRTSRQEDYAGGTAPILYLQPGHDPLAHVEDAHEFKRALGDRVTVIVIDNASHAAIEEQPEAISAALVDFANRLWR